MWAFLIGAASSVFAAFLTWLFVRARPGLLWLGSSQALAVKLTEAGMSRFHLSRSDYPGSLPEYLDKAKHLISIVSVSLKLTHDEGNLLEFFRRKLAQNPNLRITVCLLDPDCHSVLSMADTFGLPVSELRDEIRNMLKRLITLKRTLQSGEASRLRVLLRESLPMGSAIMIDATPEHGTIQVETKLYRAPRGHSFGYELRGGTRFFEHHLRAFSQVIDESREASAGD